jgi:pyrroloquinoline quinone (PQQ) biosynthesis protein C
MTFVEEINKTLVPHLVVMQSAWQMFQTSLDRDRMMRLLVETYHYIRHSVPLMQVAASRCAASHPETARYYLHHVTEEQDHDVWLLEDLAPLGLQADEIKASLPLRSTLGMVATQYYLIDRVNPAGLLGYMYILEGLTPKPSRVEEYAHRAGVPTTALRTILEHAELDPHHVSDMRDALLVDELTSADKGLIVSNAVSTVRYLTDMYRDLEDAAVSAAAGRELVSA